MTAMAVGRTQRTPLHERMYRELRSQIDGGSIGEGEQLPTELELAERFAVSRGTARHAVTRLVADGIVVRTAGRGTFVAPRRLRYTARRLLGFTEQIRASGRTPSSEVIGVEVVDVEGSGAAGTFGSSVPRLLSIERVRKADGEPVAIEHLLLPWPRFAGLRDIPLEAVSIYDTLEDLFGVRLLTGDFTLDIADLDQRQAALLQAPPGSPVFLMHGTVVDRDEQPIVAVRSYYRRSDYSFHFSLPRGAHASEQAVAPRPVLSSQ